MEKETTKALHGLEIAQRFLSTKVGLTTSMGEQPLYKTNPVKYTVLVLRDLARVGKICCN
jgi:hypothetical protein